MCQSIFISSQTLFYLSLGFCLYVDFGNSICFNFPSHFVQLFIQQLAFGFRKRLEMNLVCCKFNL